MNWMGKSTLEWFIRTDTLSLHNKCLMFTFSSFSSCFEHVSTKKHSHRRQNISQNSRSLAGRKSKFAKIFEPCWRRYSVDVRGSRKGAVEPASTNSDEPSKIQIHCRCWLEYRIARQITRAKKKLHFLAFFLRFLTLTRRLGSRESAGKTRSLLAAQPYVYDRAFRCSLNYENVIKIW